MAETAAVRPATLKGLQETAEQEKESIRESLPFTFVDVYGQRYAAQLDERVEKHGYDWSCLKRDGAYLRYEGDPAYTCRLGLDVSSHQGQVDWEKVKQQGFSFVFLRIGYRGYSQEGKLCVDKRFHENYRGARAAGLDVGVYFFSQAVTEKEAAEEAELVLQNLEGYELQCPVVFDPESILDAEARTDDVSGEQFTRNARAFCSRMEEAGFQPMLYSNMLWEAYQLDLCQLSQYPIWYADYEPVPQTPYHFIYWQYSNKGRIEGIDAETDLNLQFLPR